MAWVMMCRVFESEIQSQVKYMLPTSIWFIIEDFVDATPKLATLIGKESKCIFVGMHIQGLRGY